MWTCTSLPFSCETNSSILYVCRVVKLIDGQYLKLVRDALIKKKLCNFVNSEMQTYTNLYVNVHIHGTVSWEISKSNFQARISSLLQSFLLAPPTNSPSSLGDNIRFLQRFFLFEYLCLCHARTQPYTIYIYMYICICIYVCSLSSIILWSILKMHVVSKLVGVGSTFL